MRNTNVDLAKIFACVAVVGLHTFMKDICIETAILYYLSGFAIPFFFMSSGYFLLNRKEIPIKYSWDKIIKIIKVVFVWNMLIFIMEAVVDWFIKKENSFVFMELVLDFIRSFIQKGNLWHFWYLGALIVIYALLPFISRGGEKQRADFICLDCSSSTD